MRVEMIDNGDGCHRMARGEAKSDADGAAIHLLIRFHPFSVNPFAYPLTAHPLARSLEVKDDET